MARNTHGPSAAPNSSDSTVPVMDIHQPQRPGRRPDGMGRFGSLMASTSRSYQSLTTWLVAHTKGPVRITPAMSRSQCSAMLTPEDTTPHVKAHMGGNHVMGCSTSSIAFGCGRADAAGPGLRRGCSVAVSVMQRISCGEGALMPRWPGDGLQAAARRAD